MTVSQDDPVSRPAPGVSNPPDIPSPLCTESPATDPEGHRVDLYLDLGRTLYDAGASVQRINDSVRYCAHALGDDDVHAFVGNEAIEVGRRTGDRTQIRMHAFRNPVRVNATILQGVSRMLASLGTGFTTPEAVRSRLQELRDQPPAFPAWLTVIAVGAACAAFAWLNNADPVSLWVVFIAASIGFMAKLYAFPRSGNLYLTVLISALVASVTALVLLPLSHTATAETALISSLLFLVPGTILINGGLDIVRDHTGCGIARLTSVVAQLLVITGVLLIPLSLLSPAPGGTVPLSLCLTGLLVSTVAAGIAALGFSLMLNMPLAALPGCVICGGVARIIREVAILAGLDPIMSIFIAMAIATLLAFGIGRITHVTEVVIAVAAGLPMIPGLAAIMGLNGLFLLAHPSAVVQSALIQTTLQSSLFAVGVSLALVAGIIFPLIIITRGKPRI
ncbi:MAG: threonine/serine exporter family protein [Methanoregula sp.]|nr:threonine/serine exporter family protein [Methanoregula sp.]